MKTELRSRGGYNREISSSSDEKTLDTFQIRFCQLGASGLYPYFPKITFTV